jgi:hypothetical protein
MINNSAMNQAITRGYIKSLAELDPTTAEGIAAIAQATQFLNVHFLLGTVFPDDGLTYIYPVNPLSPAKTSISTVHRITDEDLGLINQRTYVDVEKNAAGLLIFTPQDIKLGSTVLVKAGYGTTASLRVQRGRVTGSAELDNNFRSNRIACKAVLHEVNNFFTFTLQNP